MVTAPIYALLRKGVQFSLSENCVSAFNHIKEKLSNSNILIFSDFTRPFALQTDAADGGIGFVLAQEYDSVLKLVLFGGRVLSEKRKTLLGD